MDNEMRAFRRRSTWMFGIFCAVLESAAWGWIILSDAKTMSDRFIASLIIGCFAFMGFRGAIWPVVLMATDKIVVRNPLFTFTLDHGSAHLHCKRGSTPNFEAPGRRVYLLPIRRRLLRT